MKREKKYIIESAVAKEMNGVLDGSDIREVRSGDTIATFTAVFDNGYFVDIKVCNGDRLGACEDGSAPWIDVVLFDRVGNEINCNVDEGPLEGVHSISDLQGSNEYVVTVEKQHER